MLFSHDAPANRKSGLQAAFILIVGITLAGNSHAIQVSTFVHDSFASQAAGGATVGFNIYLPPEYDGVTKYPVVYHLHGSGGDENAEISQNETLLDSCFSDSQFPRMIMVLANGYNDSFYGNPAPSISRVPVEKTIIGELINVVEERYCVKPGRNFRAMQGFSMGGQGANLYGHKYPELFCTVVSYASGCRDWYSMNSFWSGTISGYYGSKRECYEPHDSWHWTNVNQVALQNGPKMRVVVGSVDTGNNIRANNLLFMQNLTRLNLPVQFISPFNVGHDLNAYYSSAFGSTILGRDTLLFHAKAFAQTATPRFSGSFCQTAKQNNTFTYQAQASNGAITAWSAAGLPTGLSIDSSGLISGTVTGAIGQYSVDLAATNASDTGYATLIINVESGNPPVVIASQNYSVASVGVPFRYQLLLDKPMLAGGPTVTYSATSLPTWLTLDPATGLLTGTPDTATIYTISFKADNATTNNTQSHTLYVGANAAPTISIAASATAASKYIYNLKVLADDDGGEPNLTYTWVSTGISPGPVITSNGNNPAKVAQATFSRPGSYTLTVTAKDQGNLSVNSAASVVIANAAPTDISLSQNTIVENSAPGTFIGTLTTTDADLPNDAHTYSLSDTVGGRFGISGNTLVAGTTVIDYETATHYDVTIVSTDANAVQKTKTFTINVTDVSDPNTPEITWANPADIVFGKSLSSTQLNATADVAGTFTYAPDFNTVLNAGGNQTLSVTFTPNAGLNYSSATATVKINVAKATPTIEWPSRNTIYGTPLNLSHLLIAQAWSSIDPVTNAIPVQLSGTFDYNPGVGAIVEVGVSTLNVHFTPTDSNYTSVDGSTTINVDQYSPVTAWNRPANIVYGTPLGVAQLSATSDSPGSFSYNPPLGTLLNAGVDQIIAYGFTPDDTQHVRTLTGGVQFITVTRAPLAITAVSKTKSFGQANPPLSVDYSGFVNGEDTSALTTPTTISTTALADSPPGVYPIVVSAATSSNYEISFVAGTLTVTNAAPVFSSTGITFSPSAPHPGDSVQFQAVATDADGQALTFSWNFGDAAIGSGTPVSHTFVSPGTYTVQCNVSDGFGGSVTTSVDVVVAAPAEPPFPGVLINFQPAGSPAATGYLADSGAVFGDRGNGYSYGWNIGNAAASRDRNGLATLEQRYDTLLRMQADENPDATWEIEVPNGTYLVTLVSGDPSFIDSAYKIKAEDGVILDGTPTATKRWFTGRAVVAVADGRLTLSSAGGAINNKMCFVEIVAANISGQSRALNDVADLLPMNVKSVSSALNFTRSGSDTLKLALELPGLAATFNPDAQALDVDAMGAVYAFDLKKGRGRSTAGSCVMKYVKRSAEWTVAVTLSRTKLREIWADASMTKETRSLGVPFAVAVKVNGMVFGGSRESVFTNKTGKKGALK